MDWRIKEIKYSLPERLSRTATLLQLIHSDLKAYQIAIDQHNYYRMKTVADRIEKRFSIANDLMVC